MRLGGRKRKLKLVQFGRIPGQFWPGLSAAVSAVSGWNKGSRREIARRWLEREGGRASQRRNDKGNEQGINRLNVHAGGEKEQPTGPEARQSPGEETCKRAYGERERERERETVYSSRGK